MAMVSDEASVSVDAGAELEMVRPSRNLVADIEGGT